MAIQSRVIPIEKEPDWSKHPKEAGWVYLIESGGYYKIGHSKNVKKRIESIQTGSPFPVTLICKAFAYENARYTELDFHSMAVDGPWESKRLHGEWFQLSPERIEYFKDLCSGESSPEFWERLHDVR